MNVLKIIFILLEVLILFNILIFVHELGHFLAARWRGLKVQRFAIWFGKPIWKKEINGIEYVLGSIPAGGYVSLPQMAPMEMIEGQPEKKERDQEQTDEHEHDHVEEEVEEEPLPPISALDKIIVAFAGPLFSFLLAAVFAVVVWQVGRPVNEAETTTVIGYVEEGGPADRAGLQPGDKIVEVDGEPVTKFGGMGASVTWRIVSSKGDTIPIKVLREAPSQIGDQAVRADGRILSQELTFHVTPEIPETKAWERKSFRQIRVRPAQTAIIADVATNSPAAQAGLKKFDEVHRINGREIYHYAALAEHLEEHPEDPVTLTCQRGDMTFDVTLTAEVPVSPPDDKPRVGIVWSSTGHMKNAHPGVWEQLTASVDALVSTLAALFTPGSDIKAQHLSGAVKILNMYYILFESPDGWRMALWFSVLLNVNLAILNMLPIPVLDGGHIVLALIEAARRKPVSPQLLQYVQTACAMLLIGYMLYITFYDVQDLPWGGSKSEIPRMEFAPKPERPPSLNPMP